MANTDLFSRLRRLFSTDVVIRNVGGGQLKVVDTDRTQAYGSAQTNSLVDRFTRLHRTSMSAMFNPAINYQTLRTQLYNDYEAMDSETAGDEYFFSGEKLTKEGSFAYTNETVAALSGLLAILSFKLP